MIISSFKNMLLTHINFANLFFSQMFAHFHEQMRLDRDGVPKHTLPLNELIKIKTLPFERMLKLHQAFLVCCVFAVQMYVRAQAHMFMLVLCMFLLNFLYNPHILHSLMFTSHRNYAHRQFS